MPPVSIRRVEDLKWEYGSEDAPDAQDEQRAGRCFHHPGTESTPQLFEVKLRPNQVVAPHAHEHNEIIYILSGELRLGNSLLQAGSSMAILGETIYGFSACREADPFIGFVHSGAGESWRGAGGMEHVMGHLPLNLWEGIGSPIVLIAERPPDRPD